MSRGVRMIWAWCVGLAILLAFVLLGAFVPGLIGLTGTATWILRAILWGLGVLASLLAFFYLRARAKRLPNIPPDHEEVDAVMVAARRRLPNALKVGRAPVILVLGTPGSAKTSTVLHSGLEPELLAGEVHSGDRVVATDIANVWLASDSVFTEVGARLLDDPPRWTRLLHHLRPGRLAAVLGRGAQAPRLAVVCLGCDELVRPGANESVVATARALRARLSDAAREFGVDLPVYVLFTKSDNIPYFAEYVRSFTAEEAGEILGATLPFRPTGDPGRYREEETARTRSAFEGLLHALSLRRSDVLVREGDEAARAGAYEFPRGLRKTSGAAIRFLVELCRPPQVGSAPFLRGFYFTGVRPVVVREERHPSGQRAVPGVAGVGATSVFDPRSLLGQRDQAAARLPGESRRVPDWTFLPRLFRDVVLSDRVAMAITGAGARVNLWRRLLLGAAAVGTVLVTGASVVSFVANRRVVSEARAAVSTVQGVDLSGVGLAPVEDLVRLDTVRALAGRLRAWEVERRPFRTRWWLYRGDAVLEELRRVYFQRFARLLWDGTRQRLEAALATLPDTVAAASDYTSTFETLRAYIIATDHPEYSAPEAMTPVLMHHWAGESEVGEERRRLADLQFRFYASELPFGNPYDVRPDAALVERARGYLAMFRETDRLYRGLRNEASDQAPSVSLREHVPGAESVFRSNMVVRGAFTAPGWAFVQANIGDVERFFASDAWVLGEQTVPAEDRAQIEAELRQRYERDYVRTWTEFLASASVPRYTDERTAARILGRLSDNQSPLLQLLALVAEHTAVDTLTVGPAFQPVRAVMPPDAADRYIQPSNEGYIAELDQLSRTMDEIASAQGEERRFALREAEDGADRVLGVVRQMAQGFAIERGAGPVGQAVRSLLEQPAARLQPLAARLPAIEVNEKGRTFCSRVAPVLNKYPFLQGASVEATRDEVDAAFRPGGSALATLLDELQALIVREGREYVPRAGADPMPSPEFLAMLNRAQRISESLYGTDSPAPAVVFWIQPEPTSLFPEIDVVFDGLSRTVTRTDRDGRSFEWRIDTAREAKISARVEDEPLRELRELFRSDGRWSAFRLFGAAEWAEQAEGRRHRLRWTVAPGRSIAADLTFLGDDPIFRPDVIGGLGACVSTVAR